MIETFPKHLNGPRRQGGAALVVLLTLVVLLGASVMIRGLTDRSAVNLEEELSTAEALAEAKAALIAFAVTYPDNYASTDPSAGPGFLPCPDTNGNGSPNPPCGPSAIGRLPDRVLVDVDGDGNDEDVFALGFVRDGSGERLWYAVSDNFRNNPKIASLNSETPGQLKLDAASDVVAVIIAPGAPGDDTLGLNQNRQSGPNDIANFLELANADITDGDTFITATTDPNAFFNDRVAIITRTELMLAVEKRVIGEVASALKKYNANHDTFPWMTAFYDPQGLEATIDETAQSGSSGNTLNTTVDLAALGVASGDTVVNFSTGARGVVSSVISSSLSVSALTGGTSPNFSVGDQVRISRLNGAVDVIEGLVPFHVTGEAFQTAFTLDWNLQASNGADILMVGANAADYTPALQAFAETTTVSGAVPVAQNKGLCVWVSEVIADCRGEFSMTYFTGIAANAVASADTLADATRDFAAWGVGSGAVVENLDDGGAWGIVKTTTGGQLTLVEDLVDGTDNLFEGGDHYRVRVPGREIVSTATGGGPDTLVDSSKSFAALGVAVGDKIKKEGTDEWAEITTVAPSGQTDTLEFDAISPSFSIANGDDYHVYYGYVENRTYLLTFRIQGTRTLGGGERTVCSNDNLECTIVGIATNTGANDPSTTILEVAGIDPDFITAGVSVGSIVENRGDGGSRGIVTAVTADQIEVGALFGGVNNRFANGDGFRIFPIESMDDEPYKLNSGVLTPTVDSVNDERIELFIVDRDATSAFVAVTRTRVPQTASGQVGWLEVSGLWSDLVAEADPDVSGTYTGPGGEDSMLVDSGQDFYADGVWPGMRVKNTIDGSAATIISVDSETSLTISPLRGGTTNTFEVNDPYVIDFPNDHDLPLWYRKNNWQRLIYAAASTQVVPGQAGACTPDTDCLLVQGVAPSADKEVLVIAAGPQLASQDRVNGHTCGPVEPDFLCDYFEGENADYDYDELGPPPPTFEKTTASASFNDQIRIVSPDPVIQ